MNSTSPIRLLWTGGWDSTFRLLELALVHSEAVEPYYLLDPGRKSAPQELAAMERIVALVKARDPAAAARIAPPVVVPRPEPPSTHRLAQHRALNELRPAGIQYAWIATFADRQTFDDLELGIQNDGRLSPQLRA